MRVLLMGNPNVGKSVIFSRLTGTNVTSSNYPGTTVEYTEGYMKWKGKMVHIIDVPGTYSLDPTNRAEEVAVEMLKKGDLIINVVDSTNLERNLNLTLQLLEKGVPVIVALNMWDEAKHKGINIDIKKLEKHLGVPVLTTVATKGNGIRDLINLFEYRKVVTKSYDNTSERWAAIGKIIEDVQKIKHRHHTFLDVFENISIKPLTGIPIAIIVIYLSFFIVRFIGEGLISYAAEPFFETVYKPLIIRLSVVLGNFPILHNVLIGQIIGGEIDLEQSFGLLTTGLYIPFAAVLPYIISFYLVLGFLEDSGYLPRLSVLADNLMHKVGLHGFSIIPMILGFGCNVPAALAIRNLESRREKFIASTLMVISIPCIAQTAMIIGLLQNYGIRYIFYVFMILGAVWLTVGLLLDRILPGFSSDLLLEIPPFRMPNFTIVLKKLLMRISGFLKEAVPFMIFGMLIVNVLYLIKFLDVLEILFGPILNKLFGLPDEAISALLMGFLRKDLAMGLLTPLGLTPKQLVVASVVLTIYFPCIATFMVLFRELGLIDMIKTTIIMLTTSLLVGGLVNLAFNTIGMFVSSTAIILLALMLLKFMPSKSSLTE